MIKKILVPTDFSEYALNASKFAAFLAKKLDARIYFLNSVTIPDYAVGSGPTRTKQDIAEGLFILKKIKMNFENLFSQDFLKGVNAVSAIQYSGVYEDIISQAEQHEIDLIVMGTHGSSGYLNDFFIGSNTDKIVRLSKIPVLTLREEIKNPQIKSIVFASDFGDGIDESFKKVIDFAKVFDAKIEMVRVVTKNDFYYAGPMLDTMENFASTNGLTNFDCHIWTSEDVQSGINEFAQKVDADLVATATRGRRGLARLFNGSITTDIMKSSPLPILTARIQH
ncbi:MAG: universal stress protein [Brumimicrobium sp.]